MDRKRFIDELAEELSILPRVEVNQALQYYQEYFDDAIDSGKSEFEIITSLGTPKSVASQLIAASNLKEYNRQRVFEETKREPSVKNYKRTVAAVITAPIVLPLKIVLYIVCFVLSIVGFALVISFAATAFSLFLSGIACLIASIPGAIYFSSFFMLVQLFGLGLLLAGLGLIFYVFTVTVIKGSIKISSTIIKTIGRSFGGKKNEKV